MDLLVNNFDRLADNKDVMKAMFTQRQWTRINAMLSDIAENTGDVDDKTKSWMRTMTTGKSVSEAYKIQMESFDNIMKQFNNTWRVTREEGRELTRMLGKDFIPKITKLLKLYNDWDSIAGKTVVQTTMLGSGLAILGSIIGTVIASFKALSAVSGVALAPMLANPYVLVLAGIATVLGGIYITYKNIQKEREAETNELKEQQKEINKINKSTEKINENIEKQRKLLKRDFIKDINEEWSTQIDLIGKVMSESEELAGIWKSIADLSDINFSKKTDESINEIENKIRTLDSQIRYTETQIKTTNQKIAPELEVPKKDPLILAIPKLIKNKKLLKKTEEELAELEFTRNKKLAELEEQRASLIEKKNELLLNQQSTVKDSLKDINSYVTQITESINDIAQAGDNYDKWVARRKKMSGYVDPTKRAIWDESGKEINYKGSERTDEMLKYIDLIKKSGIVANELEIATSESFKNNIEKLIGTGEQLDVLNKKREKEKNILNEMMQNSDKYTSKTIKNQKGLVLGYDIAISKIKDIKEGIFEAIVGSEELNKATDRTANNVEIDSLDKLNEKLKTKLSLQMSGYEKLLQERLEYEEQLKALGNVNEKYSENLSKIERLKENAQSINKETGEILFKEEKHKKQYEDLVKENEKIKKIKQDQVNLENSISKNLTDQEKYMSDVFNYIEKSIEKKLTMSELEDLYGKKTQKQVKDEFLNRKKALEIQNKVYIMKRKLYKDDEENLKKIDEEYIATLKKLGLDKESLKNLKDELNGVEALDKKRESILEIQNKIDNLGKSQLEILGSEQIQLQEKLDKTDGELERKKLIYEIEKNKLDIIKQENVERSKTIQGYSDLLGNIAGMTDPSWIDKLSEIGKSGFTAFDKLGQKDASGKNMFQQFKSKAFSGEGEAFNLSGAISGALPIANIALGVGSAIKGIVDGYNAKQDAKHEENKRQAEERLNALKNINDTLISSNKELVSTVSADLSKFSSSMKVYENMKKALETSAISEVSYKTGGMAKKTKSKDLISFLAEEYNMDLSEIGLTLGVSGNLNKFESSIKDMISYTDELGNEINSVSDLSFDKLLQLGKLMETNTGKAGDNFEQIIYQINELGSAYDAINTYQSGLMKDSLTKRYFGDVVEIRDINEEIKNLRDTYSKIYGDNMNESQKSIVEESVKNLKVSFEKYSSNVSESLANSISDGLVNGTSDGLSVADKAMMEYINTIEQSLSKAFTDVFYKDFLNAGDEAVLKLSNALSDLDIGESTGESLMESIRTIIDKGVLVDAVEYIPSENGQMRAIGRPEHYEEVMQPIWKQYKATELIEENWEDITEALKESARQAGLSEDSISKIFPEKEMESAETALSSYSKKWNWLKKDILEVDDSWTNFLNNFGKDEGTQIFNEMTKDSQIMLNSFRELNKVSGQYVKLWNYGETMDLPSMKIYVEDLKKSQDNWLDSLEKGSYTIDDFTGKLKFVGEESEKNKEIYDESESIIEKAVDATINLANNQKELKEYIQSANEGYQDNKESLEDMYFEHKLIGKTQEEQDKLNKERLEAKLEELKITEDQVEWYMDLLNSETKHSNLLVDKNGELKNFTQTQLEAYNADLKARNEQFEAVGEYLELKKEIAKYDKESLSWIEQMTEATKSVYDAMTEALSASTYEDRIEGLSSFLFDNFKQKSIETIIEDKYKNQLNVLADSYSSALEEGSMGALSRAYSQFQSFSLQAEQDANRLEAMTSMFDYNQDVTYDGTTEQIKYEAGSTQSIINNYNNSFHISGIVPMQPNAISEFVSVAGDYIVKELQHK